MSHLKAVLALVVGLLLVVPLSAQWPSYQGPDGSAVSPETNLLDSWPEEGPPELWRISLGEGFAGLAVDQGKVCTTFAEEDQEFLACYKTDDGAEIWRLPIGETFRDQFGVGPRATPTIVDDRIYAMSGTGRLAAADLGTGKAVWTLDVTKEYGFYGPQMTDEGFQEGVLMAPIFGYASSPLVEGDLIVFEAGTGKGGSYVALDRATGEMRWKAVDEPGMTYSSPSAAVLGGERQILVYTPTRFISLNPKNGKELWRHPWSMTVSQPVVVGDDRVFISTTEIAGGQGVPAAEVLKVGPVEGAWSVESQWRNTSLRNYWASSVLLDGFLYGYDNATLRCLSAEDGSVQWAKRGLGRGSLIIADGKLLIWSEKGTLTLAEASPEGFEQKGRVRIYEQGKTWTPPSIAEGRLYLRGNKDLVSLDLKKE